MVGRGVWTAFAAAVAMAGVAGAQEGGGRAVLEISGASFKPVPVAVAPCNGPKAACAVVDETLRNDLDLSGLFDLLDPRSFLDKRPTEMNAKNIDFSKWTAVGADGLVRSVVTGDEKSGYSVTFKLFLVAVKQEKAELSGKAKGEPLRTLVHDFANKVYKEFTGETGIFRTKLAFVRRMPSGKELFVCDFDGRNQQQLTNDGKLNLLPAFSPDGKTLAFTSYRTGSPMLHLMNLATGETRMPVDEGELQTGAAFSPDGRKVAFTLSQNGSANIWMMSSNGSGLTNITNRRELESSPAWSPDGKRLAFVSRRLGTPQIFAMNADGSGEAERLTYQGNYNQTPDWSPRGDLIAFTARDERKVFDLFTVDVSTHQVKRLTQDAGDNEEPSFSPNGRHIVFSSTREGGRPRLYVMGADGTRPRPLPVADATTPAWGPALP